MSMRPQLDIDSTGEPRFHGHDNRECGEHRTVGSHRAWCYDCSEWCYPSNDGACKGCELPALRGEVRQLRQALAAVEAIAQELTAQRDWLASGERASDYGHDILAALGAAVTPTPQECEHGFTTMHGPVFEGSTMGKHETCPGPVTSTPEAATEDEMTSTVDEAALRATTRADVWAAEWMKAARGILAREGMGPEAVATLPAPVSFVLDALLDEGWMIGWFANAIEVGRDAGSRSPAPSELQRATEHDWFGRHEPEGHVTFCRLCGGRFENVRFVNCPGRATEQQQ